jgi:hypothetical protein
MANVGSLAGAFSTASGAKSSVDTPNGGDLIVIVTAHTGNTSAATPTDSQGGTYVTVVNSKKVASADTLMIHVRTALIPAAISTTFTHDPGASSGGGILVLRVGGMARIGSNASRQVGKQENQSAATPAPVFPGAALTGNPVIGAVFNATNPATMTPRSSPAYTEQGDFGYATPTTGLEYMSINSGETAATITWGSASASAFCSAVVELDATVPATTADKWDYQEPIPYPVKPKAIGY